MRIIPFLACTAITAGLVIVLNSTLVLPAPLGALLSPQHGVWQNAEPVNENFSADLQFPQLKGKVSVYFDERLVPHVFADQENDAYFVQGYIHAKFRLWQMELQTFAAAGRVSEIIGEKGLAHDREFRRLGMVYAAEVAVKEMEKDPAIKAECDAYTAGVNAYIEGLTESKMPLEYKLMGYKPEPWTNLKTALFLKYMSQNLASGEDDFEMTNAKSYFNTDDFAKLFPAIQDSLDPIIPKGTPFEKQKVFPVAPAGADSAYINNKDMADVQEEKADRANGSNNWAVSGKKTRSGAPILCNDPHLGLNLPSLWFEMQLSTPSFNVYGATFPGSPSVIIGFNDSCAFGVTNGGRDVRDYYEIKFKDDSRTQYLYNGNWQTTEWRIDTIKIKGKADYIDSVAYVNLGGSRCPVMYDRNYAGVDDNGDGPRVANKRSFAVRWKAHDPSVELKYFNLINRAKNYSDYQAAAVNFHTPGQNVVFACKNGDIAMRTQGEWPAKWKGQGDYIMPGTDSSYLWQGMIPQDEVPFQYNPERGFVSSANQKPVDESYPYYIGRNYPEYRGIMINRKLAAMNDITPKDMMLLQNDNYNIVAEMALSFALKNIKESELNADEKKYADMLKQWDLRNDPDSKGATIFEVWWDKLGHVIYDDEYAKAPKVIMHPFESTMLEQVLKDSAYSFLDDISTAGKKETLADDVTAALKKAAAELKQAEAAGMLEWGKYKQTTIYNLAKLPAFSRSVVTGGSGHNINANKMDVKGKAAHGPSWRMIVSLTPETEAYGVYPGGQSGNPGSKYYDGFVDKWAAGEYYTLWMMKKEQAKDTRVKYVMNFGGSGK